MNIPTFRTSNPISWTPLMSGVDATMNSRTLSSLDQNVLHLFDACVGKMTWASLAMVGGNGKTFIHMARYPIILSKCLMVMAARKLPIKDLINFPTEIGGHSAYDLYWHSKDMKWELKQWGGQVVNPMSTKSGKTGKGRGNNLGSDDARNRRFQGYGVQQDGDEVEEELLEV